MSAKNLLESEDGAFLINYINERVSVLINKITSATAADERTYLDVHGGIKELQTLNTMLYTTAEQLEAAKEEIDAFRQDTDTTSA